jgi:hypothetical protein
MGYIRWVAHTTLSPSLSLHTHTALTTPRRWSVDVRRISVRFWVHFPCWEED